MNKLLIAFLAILACVFFGAAALLWIRRRWFQLRGRSLPHVHF